MTVSDDARGTGDLARPDAKGRPRPEYGEYASPEEQARAIARSGPGTALPSIPAASGPEPAAGPQAPSTRAGIVDRLITVFLLALGLVYLIGGAGGYLNLATTLGTVYAQFGIGEYAPTPQTPLFGVAIVVCHAIIWVAAAVWARRRLSRGRRSWWVPVLGAGVTFLLTVVLFGALLAGDPAFLAYVSAA